MKIFLTRLTMRREVRGRQGNTTWFARNIMIFQEHRHQSVGIIMLDAWSVFLIATLHLLSIAFVAFYTNIYQSISQFTLVTSLMLAEELRK
jgi:hypothetical protein